MSTLPANDPNRPMPSAHEMERAILCCAMQNADVTLSRLRSLTIDHFYHPAHACLWHEMTVLHDEGKPIDIQSLAQRLIDRNLLNETGGPMALADIISMSAVPAHLDYYADMVKEKHVRRAGLLALSQAQTALWDESMPYSDALTAASEVIFDLQKKEGAKREFRQVKPLVFEAVENIQAVAKRRGHVTGGIATGFTDLDRRLMGTKPGQMIIIAGRPAMGKTAFMMNIAENIATGSGHFGEFDQQPLPVAVVSLEMGGAELMQRMLLSRSKISLLRLRDGFMEKDMSGLHRVAGELGKAPLHILDTSGLDIISLASLLRQFVPANGIKVVCVDYLQLLKSTSRAAQSNRYVEVGEVSRGLKSIAKELGITLFVAAQIGRKAEERRDAIPRLSDLRESGDIENDADIIGMLHRPLYYANDKDKEDRDNDDLYTDDINENRIEKATLIIGKHRGGPVGEVPLGWRGELARFESLRNKLNSNNPNEQE